MASDFLEGRHALEEALSTGAPIEAIFVSDAARRDKRVASSLKKAKKRGILVKGASEQQLDDHSAHGAHQGVIARLAPFTYVGLGDLIERAAGKRDCLILACDHITDAGNFGAMLRSAEVVGACGALVPNRRSARVTTATYKTSAGAVMHLPIAMEANLASCLERLKEEGFWVVGASEHADQIAWDAPLSGRIVLVMGSEEKGLAPLTVKTCDLLVKLPQAGNVESLNVAQATTVLAYEWMRQCNATKR
ncbi:MAG: 23S rRNA (guanosine(2251)-2'-O)-methyltransferase RlmB [Coriobacteriales bacterium]|jgi:23S rRNA (guanosine2251-2'-O)-methyltransferase